MRFHANYVSTSVSSDYHQAMFEAEQDSDDVDSPYLLIQRQFEDPDDDWCYIKMHDKNYIGHFHLRRVEFTPHNLSIEFDQPRTILSALALRWRLRTLRKHHAW
jgi:hypothetical protein